MLGWPRMVTALEGMRSASNPKSRGPFEITPPEPASPIPVLSCRQVTGGQNMDRQTKREMVILALSTLAVAPVVAGMGFVVVSGIVSW